MSDAPMSDADAHAFAHAFARADADNSEKLNEANEIAHELSSELLKQQIKDPQISKLFDLVGNLSFKLAMISNYQAMDINNLKKEINNLKGNRGGGRSIRKTKRGRR